MKGKKMQRDQEHRLPVALDEDDVAEDPVGAGLVFGRDTGLVGRATEVSRQLRQHEASHDDTYTSQETSRRDAAEPEISVRRGAPEWLCCIGSRPQIYLSCRATTLATMLVTRAD